MNTIVLIFIFIVIFIILVICSGYASSASVSLGKLKSDTNLASAYSYVTWAVSIIWILLIGMIIGIIALVFFGPELLPLIGGEIFYLALVVMFIAIIAIAITCSISIYYIRQSESTDTNKTTAQSDAEIAAGIAYATIIFVFAAYWYINRTPVDSEAYQQQQQYFQQPGYTEQPYQQPYPRQPQQPYRQPYQQRQQSQPPPLPPRLPSRASQVGYPRASSIGFAEKEVVAVGGLATKEA